MTCLLGVQAEVDSASVRGCTGMNTPSCICTSEREGGFVVLKRELVLKRFTALQLVSKAK